MVEAEDLLGRNRLQAFAPDTPEEALNRGYHPVAAEERAESLRLAGEPLSHQVSDLLAPSMEEVITRSEHARRSNGSRRRRVRAWMSTTWSRVPTMIRFGPGGSESGRRSGGGAIPT